MRLHMLLLVCFAVFSCVFSIEEETTVGKTSTVSSTSSSVTPQPTSAPKNESCDTHDGDCDKCVENKKCFFCETDKKCRWYDISEVVPSKECDLNKVKYSTCSINMKLVIILVGTLAGIIFLIILCVCCWCCCKRKGVKFSKDDLKFARQREERRVRAEERKKERADRTEEIRRKYGLMKDDNPYQRFDA